MSNLITQQDIKLFWAGFRLSKQLISKQLTFRHKYNKVNWINNYLKQFKSTHDASYGLGMQTYVDNFMKGLSYRGK